MVLRQDSTTTLHRCTCANRGSAGQDSNRDGIRDGNESALGFRTVQLRDLSGMTLNMTFTDAEGLYSFSDVQPGNYYVVFSWALPLYLTWANLGGDDSLDSDADAVTGWTPLLTVGAGQTLVNVDAGYTNTPVW